MCGVNLRSITELRIQVSVKDLAVSMDLGNNGIAFDLYDNSDNDLGDLRIRRRTIEWCKGRTRRGNGVRVNWTTFIRWFEEQE